MLHFYITGTVRITKQKDAAKCGTKELISDQLLVTAFPTINLPPGRGLPLEKDTVKHRTKQLKSDQPCLTTHTITTVLNRPVKQDNCGC